MLKLEHLFDSKPVVVEAGATDRSVSGHACKWFIYGYNYKRIEIPAVGIFKIKIKNTNKNTQKNDQEKRNEKL